VPQLLLKNAERYAEGRNMTMTLHLSAKSLFAGLLGLAVMAGTAQAAGGGGPEYDRQAWSFAGFPLIGKGGYFDNNQLQRGFLVYKEVCSSCHGMKLVPFRALSEKGGPEFPEEGVKSLAATYKVVDGPNDQGKMFKRPGLLSDIIPGPFSNDQEARSANNGALPPDFSVLAKARGIDVERPFYMVPIAMVRDIFTGYQEAGPDYIYAVLTGYGNVPAGFKNPDGTAFKVGEGMNFNSHFPGYQIGMANPLADGQVKYTDGTPTTVANYARDVTAFMAWAADPKLEERKRLGILAVGYLLITAVLLGLAKKRVWANVPH
jgi:ubiquinol-cytochrome c reductase cytochrome c1 subunit